MGLGRRSHSSQMVVKGYRSNWIQWRSVYGQLAVMVQDLLGLKSNKISLSDLQYFYLSKLPNITATSHFCVIWHFNSCFQKKFRKILFCLFHNLLNTTACSTRVKNRNYLPNHFPKQKIFSKKVLWIKVFHFRPLFVVHLVSHLSLDIFNMFFLVIYH